MSKSGKSKLDYNGFIILKDNGLVCLTDMWRAAGAIKTQKVDYWLKPESNCLLLLQILLESKPDLKPEIERVLATKPQSAFRNQEYRNWTNQVKQIAVDAGLIKITKGKIGGTYAIDKIAIAYAQFLSPEFHAWALTAIKERIEEEADPELGITRSRQRAIRAWERQGKSTNYISARLDSIPREDYYESALYQHGVTTPKEFAWCKTKVYEPIIGHPNSFRANRGLKKGQNLKDGMNIEELSTTDFAKVLSTKRINTLNPDNARSCASISYSAAQQIANLLNQ
ncbi:KilA-N domain-containing protein [Argonema galeatum]|uniref:KilA-N domain-containing protein n=1 Tax=Argonema galeatum TaxID=2942762 RepID=UPI0020126ABF|nr:KilA-N domain-containing protein [Argonema galeatum]MCL1465948.1 KilA-N domain-containing protein [Argonema galeatum A003/A1]